MSGIGAVTPANKQPSVEGQQPERDGRKRPPRNPRKPRSDDDLVEVEPRKLDLEA
jgi:hypothetical protein